MQDYISKTGDGIYMTVTNSRGDTSVRQLTNFTVRVTSVTHDYRQPEPVESWGVEANFGGERRSIRIKPQELFNAAWVAKLGPKARVAVQSLATDHLRSAIVQCSDDVRVKLILGETGWAVINEELVFLHCGGIIKCGQVKEHLPEGTNNNHHNLQAIKKLAGARQIRHISLPSLQLEDVEVQLPGPLSDFELGTPLDDRALKQAAAAFLELFEVAADDVTVPLLLTAVSAPLVVSASTIWLDGSTGVGKTVVVALAQSLYGRRFTEENLPASWEDTPTARERISNILRYVFFVVDDYQPNGMDAAKKEANADRFVRSQHNQRARIRSNAQGGLTEFCPGAVAAVTAEATLGTPSALNRTVTVTVEGDDVNWERISEAQLRAKEGMFSDVLATFIQWLGRSFDAIQQCCVDFRHQLRLAWKEEIQDGRLSAEFAALEAAGRVFFHFLFDRNVISAKEGIDWLNRVRNALRNTALQMQSVVQEADAADQFKRLILSLLASKQVYVTTRMGGRPKDAESLGWSLSIGETIVNGKPEERECWQHPKAKDSMIGWADDEHIYLNCSVAIAAVRRLAMESGETLQVTPRTLGRTLARKGWLIHEQEKRNAYVTRITIDGKQQNVLKIKLDKILESPPLLAALDEDPIEDGPMGLRDIDYNALIDV